VTDLKEHILVTNVIAGDTKAFGVLVDAHKDMAVHLAYNILLNQEDAEEVAQDAFIKAFAALPAFKADARFATWLYRIVVNTALNKKKVKKHNVVELTEALREALPSAINTPYAIQITGEHKKYIQLALQALTVRERLCITLYYLNELSVEEIHEITDLSNANIKVLLYRGRKNLYTALHNHLKNEITNLI
jgi:RNA polymerase sigma factor (sigma-70 family)